MALGPESTVPSSQRGPALWQQYKEYNVPETDKNTSSNGNGFWRIKFLQLFSSCTPGLEITADAMSIFNNGEPVPPDWTTHCCCCLWEIRFAGIPEGTPRVPAAEEKEILRRWQGRYECVRDDGIERSHLHVQGDVMTLSGGLWRHTRVRSHGETRESIGTRGAFKGKLSFWRGSDGVLYIDNLGSKLESETPMELAIVDGAAPFGHGTFRRVTEPVAPGPPGAPTQMERGGADVTTGEVVVDV